MLWKFKLCDFCILIKHGLLNGFCFKAYMNCFWLKVFHSILPFWYFYTIKNFIIIIIMIIFIITVVIIISVIAIAVISSFSMFLIFIILFFIIPFYLCIYQVFLNFKNVLNVYDVTEHCSELAIKTLRLYQCLWWKLWTVFV